ISRNSDVHLGAAISIYMTDGAHAGANVGILEECAGWDKWRWFATRPVANLEIHLRTHASKGETDYERGRWWTVDLVEFLRGTSAAGCPSRGILRPCAFPNASGQGSVWILQQLQCSALRPERLLHDDGRAANDDCSPEQRLRHDGAAQPGI